MKRNSSLARGIHAASTVLGRGVHAASSALKAAFLARGIHAASSVLERGIHAASSGLKAAFLGAFLFTILHSQFPIQAGPPAAERGFFLPRQASASGPWYSNPGSITNCALFLTYKDLPAGSTGVLWGWTNHFSPFQVFTNGGAICTNSTNGVYFYGGHPNFANASLTIGASNLNCSVAFCATLDAGENYGEIIGFANSGGEGIFESTTPNIIDGSAVVYAGVATLVGSQVDYALVPQGAGLVNGYTNGIYYGQSTHSDKANFTVYGIGCDADGDVAAYMHLKWVAIYTNYTMTANDIASNHVYSVGSLNNP